MEDRSIIIGGVIVLVVVLFVLMLIPGSKTDVLGQMGTDAVRLGNSTGSKPSQAPVPTITELSAQKVKAGTGSAAVKSGDTIVVNYKGAFTDGKIFDDSYSRNQPFKVQIGAKQVIPGFEQGVVGMLVGEIRRLFIPANLAYGAQGQGSVIPPNTPLIFDVELMSIEATPTSSSEAEIKTPEISAEQGASLVPTP